MLRSGWVLIGIGGKMSILRWENDQVSDASEKKGKRKKEMERV